VSRLLPHMRTIIEPECFHEAFHFSNSDEMKVG
jgi:hypothetical protein